MVLEWNRRISSVYSTSQPAKCFTHSKSRKGINVNYARNCSLFVLKTKFFKTDGIEAKQ